MPHGMSLACAPTGIRTPVVALKGLRPSPLDDGGNGVAYIDDSRHRGGLRQLEVAQTERADFIIPPCNGQALFYFSSFAR